MSGARAKQASSEGSKQWNGPRKAEPGAQLAGAGGGGGQSPAAAATSRLVFGLSSRTNRLKHDEYAAGRSKTTVSSTPERAQVEQKGADRESNKSNMSENGLTQQKQSAAPLRPSTQGNFYKPQELSGAATSSSGKTTAPAQAEQTGASESAPGASKGKAELRRRSPSPERRRTQSASLKIGEPPTATLTSDEMREKAPKEQAKAPRMQFNIPPPPQLATSLTSGKSSVVSFAKSRIYEKPTRQQQQQHNLQMLNSFISPAPGQLSRQASSPFDLAAPIPKSILSGFKPPKQVNVSKAREKWEGGEPFAKTKSRQRLAAQASKKLLHGTWSMTSVVATQQLQLQQALANASSPIRSNVERSDPSVKILTRGSVLERVQQFERAPGASLSASSSASSLSSDESSGSSTSGSSESPDAEAHFSASLIAADYAAANLKELEAARSAPAKASDAAETARSPQAKQALYKTRVSHLQSSAGQQSKLEPLKLSSTVGAALGPLSPKSPTLASPGGAPFAVATSPAAAGAASQRRLSLRRKSSSASSTTNNSSSLIPRFYHPNGKPNTYEIELQKKNIVACFDKLPDRKALLTSPAYKRHFHSIALACGFSEYFKEPLFRYVRHQMTQSNLLHNSGPQAALRKQSGLAAANLSSSLNNANNNNNNNNNNADSSSSNNIKTSAPRLVNSTALQAAQTNSAGEQPAPAQKLRPLMKAASIDNSTMEKIQNQTYITCDQFLLCWRQIISSSFDLPARFIHLLTLGQRQFLLPDDFVPLIQSIIDDHPGLKFLRAAPDFHMRYIQTVIARIYFCINKSWTGKISLKELRKSNLMAVLQVLSQEEDINQITDYFSYEHFYVIYCKFWSLDQDHDLLISKEDLAKHNDAAISSRIIDRIFMGIVSKQIQMTGKMSYTDFVWFLIAEEDKKHPRSVEYWFRLMDLDGDGYISMYEMEYFYYEQTKRLELMNIEALPFLDSACQILDLVNPKEKNKISLSDLKRTKLATIFFDTFINLEKYLEHESREFVSTRDIVQDGVVISDWDHYASEEYENLVTEETSV